MVKDYECRSIVNQMLEVNQISMEKPRGPVNVQSDIKRRDNYRHDTIENLELMPFNRAIDGDDPYLSSLTFDKVASLKHNKFFPSNIDKMSQISPIKEPIVTNTLNFTCDCPKLQGIDYCCSKAMSWLDIINKKYNPT
jgi:hypothetical protein